MLRARKPEAVTKRLKLFMFGPAGVGKTTAAIQFPNSYIIDCERGAENYDKLIAASEGTTDKWFAKAGVDVWEDMPADVIAKCIEYVKSRLPAVSVAA